MNWIVLWTIITVFSIPCPQPEPRVDEYGIVHYSSSINAVLCTDKSTKEMSKTFATEEEALAFIENAPKCGEHDITAYIQGSCVKNFIIGEIT